MKPMFPYLLCAALLVADSCGEHPRREKPARGGSPLFSPAAAAALQLFCDSAAAARNAGIAVADLATGELVAMSNRDYLATTSRMPASTFKIVTATTALLAHISVPSGFACRGFVLLGRDTIRCWERRGHGVQTLPQALGNSCNCYFARLASLCPAEQLVAVARKFGCGRVSFFRQNGEDAGYLADALPEEKKILFGLGHSAFCRVTGLQLLQIAAIVGTRGAVTGRTRLFDWERIDPVRRGMERAVLNGTASAALDPEYPAAGKTGTLEAAVGWRTSGWFCGYAPYDRPEVALVVFCADGTGANAASPLAGAVIRKIANLRRAR